MSDLNENIKKLKKHLDIIKEQGVLNVVDGELKNSNSRNVKFFKIAAGSAHVWSGFFFSLILIRKKSVLNFVYF